MMRAASWSAVVPSFTSMPGLRWGGPRGMPPLSQAAERRG